MNLRDNIKRIIKEETQLPTFLRRRIKFDDIEKLINKRKLVKFNKDLPITESIRATILATLYDLMPDGFDEDNQQYYKVWDELKDYLYLRYNKELYKYFENRKQRIENKKDGEGVKYIFVKHDKPYYDRGWRGFAEGWDSFDDVVREYGTWIDVDWDNIEKKLDSINDFPEDTLRGRYNSRPLRISSIGDEGNKWGYNFSIIKSIAK